MCLGLSVLGDPEEMKKGPVLADPGTVGCHRWQVRRDEDVVRLSLWLAPPGTCTGVWAGGSCRRERLRVKEGWFAFWFGNSECYKDAISLDFTNPFSSPGDELIFKIADASPLPLPLYGSC